MKQRTFSSVVIMDTERSPSRDLGHFQLPRILPPESAGGVGTHRKGNTRKDGRRKLRKIYVMENMFVEIGEHTVWQNNW